MKRVLFVLCVFSLCAATARAEMRITEWMYKGAKINAAEEENEFIEFTNVGSTNVDMTGWSYDDNSQTSGTVDLSAFGIVAPGESVILAEPNEADFRTEWNLASTIKVIGSNGANLGRNDEINLYDDSDTLVDQLTFGDEDFPGSIRTQCVSGNPSNPSVLGENEVL
ncbi:MAG: lamin tail domain-containing protein, partial [Pirellulales bacterium]|nr:lamin tail domain-containing protein [Pirellulales bacterium]